MENFQANGLGRDCMLDGALGLIGVGTSYWGGWILTLTSVAHAASIGCFD